MPVLSTLGAAIANVYGFTSGLIKDQYFNLVSLLLPGNGTNGAQNNTFLDGSSNTFAITRNGNTTQGTFSPFSQTGWSNYFPGSSSTWINAPDNAVLELGSNNFTIECWIYATSSFSATRIISSKYNHFVLGINTTPALTFSWYGTSSSSSIGTLVDTSINKWHHIAICRSGSTLYMFQNGQQLTLTNSTITGTLNNDVTGPIIGGNSNQSGGSIISANDPWVGYVSNYRLTNGAALYTSGFTPSTSPLTTTSQGASASQVEWLTAQSNRFADNSDNQFTLTVNGSPSVTPFSPFAPTQSYSAASVGGSGYFDGTGDYLDVANNAALQLGTSDFTLEAWAYLIDQAGTANHVIISKQNYLIYYEEAISKWIFETNLGSITSSSTWPLSAWQHVAATRSGNTFTLWVNGTSQGTLTNSGSVTDAGGLMNIGRNVGNSSNYTQGYLSSLRLVKGTAVYTSAFTPPTAPLTAITNTSLLLNFTNAGITDATAKNVLETVGNAQISTTQSKWGGGSIAFNGTTDYLVSSASLSEWIAFHNGGPFTIDLWFYTGSTASMTLLGTNAATATTGFYLAVNDTAARDIGFFVYRGVGGSVFFARSSGSVWSLNDWNYVTVTMDSSKNLTIYVNGSSVATASGTSFSFSSGNASYPFAVGRFQSASPGGYFNGYIDDLRMTKSVVRSATTPTAPFPVQ